MGGIDASFWLCLSPAQRVVLRGCCTNREELVLKGEEAILEASISEILFFL